MRNSDGQMESFQPIKCMLFIRIFNNPILEMTPNWKHYSNSSRYFDSQHYVFNEEAAGTNCINILFHHSLNSLI